MRTPSIVGRRVTLSDEGEGWFAGYADVSGTIESLILSNENDNPIYVVRLDTPLELQESGATPSSGFILRRYSHCLIHCRWRGFDINFDSPVSVHVLVPAGDEPPKNTTDVVGMNIRAWAACIIAPDSRI